MQSVPRRRRPFFRSIERAASTGNKLGADVVLAAKCAASRVLGFEKASKAFPNNSSCSLSSPKMAISTLIMMGGSPTRFVRSAPSVIHRHKATKIHRVIYSVQNDDARRGVTNWPEMELSFSLVIHAVSAVMSTRQNKEIYL